MDNEKKLKVYCETSFWSFLNGGNTPLEHIAVKQSATLRWWEEFSTKCEIFISPYVADEAEVGNPERAAMRKHSMAGCASLDGSDEDTINLAEALIVGHAVPENESTDAFHIATAAVKGMDVLLTWNCKHMANPVTLPKTAAIITKTGYVCPVIITPAEFMERREEFGYEK